MKLSQFNFKLPEELIAQEPASGRDESRLMVVNRKTGEIKHEFFKDVIQHFDEGDIFIFNDTDFGHNLWIQKIIFKGIIF